MNNSATRLPLLALALLTLPAMPASATIIGTYTDNGNGTGTYSYVVDNTGGPFDIFLWSLDLDLAALDWNQLDVLSGGDVDVPNLDWFADVGIPVTGQSAQDFFSPFSDVLIDDSLGGFSFTSNFLPGTVTYHEFSATGDSSTGTTVGPAFARVPDSGGGLVLIAIASLAAFAAGNRRLRTNRQASCAS